MRPLKNGRTVETQSLGHGYQLWEGDEWVCRGCGTTVVVGFGTAPSGEHYEPDYAAKVAKWKPIVLDGGEV